MNDANNNNAQGNIRNNENRGRGLFYAVIAVATFIIMAVGATFAYFTATTQSTNSSVQTGSTTLQLKYISYQSGWMNSDLIPADTAIAEYSFENQNDTTVQTDESDAPVEELSNAMCKDDYGNSICSVYVFQVTNGANSPQSVSISIVSETNGFSSLNAMAYELTLEDDNAETYNSTDNNNGFSDPSFTYVDLDADSTIDVVDGDGTILEADAFSPIYVNRAGVTKTLLKYIASTDADTGATVMYSSIDRLLVTVDDTNMYSEASERSTTVADDITISGGETRTFAIVLYIKNSNTDQTATDAAKTFSGQVVVGTGDGTTGVSGSISAYVSGSVQSESDSGTEGNGD